jgi:hypothetical protein
MNSHIHSLLAAYDLESRIQDAANERLARELRRQRRDARRAVPKRRRLHGHLTARA